jgi:hypothetical protein
MTNKINILQVVSRHFDTFRHFDSRKLRGRDIALFFGIPLALSLCSAKYSYAFSDTTISNLLNVEALLSGLLLNLLVLVYSLKEKTPKTNVEVEGWEDLQIKHRVVNEVYFNVAFSTLSAFIMLIFTVLHSFFVNLTLGGFVINAHLIDPIIIFLGLNLILNFLMIIKRISVLFCCEGD